MVRKKIMKYFKKTIEKEGKDKSKVQYLPEWKPGGRLEYMNKLTRNQVSIVFQARTRIIMVKENYKKDKGTSYTEYAEQR